MQEHVEVSLVPELYHAEVSIPSYTMLKSV